MSTDPIANMLTKLRNAFKAKNKEVSFPHSNIKEAMLKLIKKEGYVSEFKVEEVENKKNINVILNLELPDFNLKRISKPGRRVNAGSDDLKPVMFGYGLGIVSTSQGIKSFRDAKKEKLGGEILAHIW